MIVKTVKLGMLSLLWIMNVTIQSAHAAEPLNLINLNEQIAELQQRYHYNPTELNSAEFKHIQAEVLHLAERSPDLNSFVNEFNHLWQSGPFSHVRLAPAQTDAKSLASQLDKMLVGKDAVQLSWPSANTALLEINTMMGIDTIEYINKAFVEIDYQKPDTLIIDLRKNNGGAFAVKPLVEHLIATNLDVGVFVSQLWFKDHNQPPQSVQIKQIDNWSGWSIERFWIDVQSTPFTRIQMQPSKPYYAGKVFVLTSKQTASAAEMAADALSQLPNVTLVGETTAGQMLSQTLFDLPHNLHLFIPVADYYSAANGRIEGHGVVPDISIEADKALSLVLAKISL